MAVLGAHCASLHECPCPMCRQRGASAGGPPAGAAGGDNGGSLQHDEPGRGQQPPACVLPAPPDQAFMLMRRWAAPMLLLLYVLTCAPLLSPRCLALFLPRKQLDPAGPIARQRLFSIYVHTMPGFCYHNSEPPRSAIRQAAAPHSTSASHPDRPCRLFRWRHRRPQRASRRLNHHHHQVASPVRPLSALLCLQPPFSPAIKWTTACL